MDLPRARPAGMRGCSTASRLVDPERVDFETTFMALNAAPCARGNGLRTNLGVEQ